MCHVTEGCVMKFPDIRLPHLSPLALVVSHSSWSDCIQDRFCFRSIMRNNKWLSAVFVEFNVLIALRRSSCYNIRRLHCRRIFLFLHVKLPFRKIFVFYHITSNAVHSLEHVSVFRGCARLWPGVLHNGKLPANSVITHTASGEALATIWTVGFKTCNWFEDFLFIANHVFVQNDIRQRNVCWYTS